MTAPGGVLVDMYTRPPTDMRDRTGRGAPLRTTAPLRVRQVGRGDLARRNELVAELLDDGPAVGRARGRPPGSRGTQVGVARYALDADGVAVISLEVVDGWQATGIGSRLLDLLLAQGERAGVRRWRSGQRTSASAATASLTAAAGVSEPARSAAWAR